MRYRAFGLIQTHYSKSATSSELNSCLEIMSPSSSVVSKTIEPEMNLASQKPGNSSYGHGLIEGGGLENSKAVIGVLDVYIHQARDVQNICIYHKQDVYAKICLTDDPEKSASTHTVNGGGRDPVFNENLRLDVRSIESSLKCEVWMLSRIKNYLQDQLLGFALVPLTDIVIENGKLSKEFSLTSDDMFHSPTGSVQLTLVYNGAAPEVLEIPSTHSSLLVGAVEQGNEGISSVPREFAMIEFADPKIATENEMMVTEYYAIPCVNLDSEDPPKSIDNPDNDIPSKVDAPAPVVESNEVIEVSKVQTSESSVSVNGFLLGPLATDSSSPSISVVTSSPSVCDSLGALKLVALPEEKTEDVAKVLEVVVSHEEKTEDVANASDFDSHPEKTEGVAKASGFANQDVVLPNEKTKDVGETHVSEPLVSVNIEPEQSVVQQDYVNLYMKSMQQFTEALAKMNLPLEIGEAAPKEKEKNESAKKEQTSKDSGPRPKVFYGSRAFF